MRAPIIAFVVAIILLLGGKQPPSRPGLAPLVGAAAMPLYPPAAWGLGMTGKVVIAMKVDDGGTAIAVVKASRNAYLAAGALENAKSWRFQKGMPGSFEVTYVYKIQGTATDLPQTPKVVAALPFSVTVIARPYK